VDFVMVDSLPPENFLLPLFNSELHFFVQDFLKKGNVIRALIFSFQGTDKITH